MKYLTTLLCIIFLSFPLVSRSAGIQVSPARLDFMASDNKQASQQITVANPTADVQLFEIYADDFSQAITAMPKSFTLEAGGRKTVIITINPANLDKDVVQALGLPSRTSRNNNQLLSTNLSIVSRPLTEEKVSVSTGVKLPLTVSVTASTNQNWNVWIFAGAGLLIALIIAAVVVYILKRHQPTSKKQKV